MQLVYLLKKILKPKKIQINLSYNGSPISGLGNQNLGKIQYQLLSEQRDGKFNIRHIEIGDNGKYFIEAADNDFVYFDTPLASPNMPGLHWGKGLPIDGSQANDDAYFYTSDDRVRVSNGVALASLKLDRLPMYAAYITNIEDKRFTIRSISINGTDSLIRSFDEVYNKSVLNLADYTEDYMSYEPMIQTLEYSVVVHTSNGGDTTLTASIDLSKNNKLLLDGSIIK